MYKVLEVTIDGFWNEFKAHGVFKDDVNIVIGKNGSGKTTFMNILHAVLSVDIDALDENDFTVAIIKLHDGNKVKTIKAEKREIKDSPFPLIVYQISTKKYLMPIVSSDDRIQAPSLRRRAIERSQEVRDELAKLVSLASLSVYRIKNDQEQDVRERSPRRSISPVDMRLSNLRQSLTLYQLDVSNLAREVSSELQRDVLISLLHKKDSALNRAIQLDFDEIAEKQNLISAYKQLGVSGHDITKQINDHTAAISECVSALKNLKDADVTKIDFSALEARNRTKKVIEMSLTAEEKTKRIFSQIDNFLGTLKSFIPDKDFLFIGGDLQLKQNDKISVSRLSSGEKQLLILFIETLLQRQKPYVFLADEPELSLHISWQRNVIAAIRALNPHAQIIVATHSPEIAGGFKDRIMDMEDMLHV